MRLGGRPSARAHTHTTIDTCLCIYTSASRSHINNTASRRIVCVVVCVFLWESSFQLRRFIYLLLCTVRLLRGISARCSSTSIDLNMVDWRMNTSILRRNHCDQRTKKRPRRRRQKFTNAKPRDGENRKSDRDRGRERDDDGDDDDENEGKKEKKRETNRRAQAHHDLLTRLCTASMFNSKKINKNLSTEKKNEHINFDETRD